MSKPCDVPTPMTAHQVFEREFLEIRAKLLELAASFDRLDRGRGDVGDDARLASVRRALDVLSSSKPGRAEKIQLIFSRQYHASWQEELGVSGPGG